MRTLIIGAAGFLGSRLQHALGRGCVGTYHLHPTAPDQVFLDLTNPRSIQKCISHTAPDVVIHCGGITRTDLCEAERDLAYRTHVLGARSLVDQYQGKIIFLSTDYVFDGHTPPYSETATPRPLNYYGTTKAEAERVILAKSDNLVVRVSGLYGYNVRNNRFIQALNESEVHACTDLVSTPTYIEDIVVALPDLYYRAGVLHLAGHESFSRYAFLRLAAERLGLSVRVLPTRASQSTVRRPSDSSLASIHRVHTTPAVQALDEIRAHI